MEELEKTFDGVMTTIYEEYIYCGDEMQNAEDEKEKQRFANMSRAYLNLICLYGKLDEFKHYKKVSAKFRD